MSTSAALDRNRTFRHGVLSALERALRAAAGLGLDVDRLRVSVEDAAGAGSTVGYTPYRDAELVDVAGPGVDFDPDPDGRAGSGAAPAWSYARPRDGVLTIPNGRFGLPAGFTSVGERLLSETLPSSAFPAPRDLLPLARLLLGEARPVHDGVLIDLPGSEDYHLWLTEVLPRALLLADYVEPELPLYLSRNLPRFAAESLAALGLGDRCVPLSDGVYTARRLLQSSWERPAGPAPEDVELVRRGLLGALAPESPLPPRRLLISRGDRVGGRLANPEVLVRTLADLGIEPFSLEAMTLAEQVTLFSTAEVVIAPRGAGLTNLLFAPAGCRAIELTASAPSARGVVLASLLDQPYGSVRGRRQGGELHVDPTAVALVLDRLGTAEDPTSA